MEGNESVRPYKDVGLSLFKFTMNVADRLKEYRKRKMAILFYISVITDFSLDMDLR